MQTERAAWSGGWIWCLFCAGFCPELEWAETPLDSSEAHTSQKAEFYALRRALDTVERAFGDNMTISQIVTSQTRHIWLMG